MTDTPTTPKAPKAAATPAQALDKAIQALITAANNYAASDDGQTTHSYASEAGFRVRFMNEQFQSLTQV